MSNESLSGQGRAIVAAKTANYTVVAGNDNGKCFTNEGAAGAITFSLPPATVGQRYAFYVKATQELRIDPNGTETISLLTGVQQAAGKYIVADAIGEFIRIVCVKAGEWTTDGGIGTFTAEA